MKSDFVQNIFDFANKNMTFFFIHHFFKFFIIKMLKLFFFQFKFRNIEILIQKY